MSLPGLIFLGWLAFTIWWLRHRRQGSVVITRTHRAAAMAARGVPWKHDVFRQSGNAWDMDQDELNSQRAIWWRGRRCWLPPTLHFRRPLTFEINATAAQPKQPRGRVYGAFHVNHLWTAADPNYDYRKAIVGPYRRSPHQTHVLLPWHHKDFPTAAEVMAKGFKPPRPLVHTPGQGRSYILHGYCEPNLPGNLVDRRRPKVWRDDP